MQSLPISRLSAQPSVQCPRSQLARATREKLQAPVPNLRECKQRTTLLAPSSLDAALLSRLLADPSSPSQLDPLSSLQPCPALHRQVHHPESPACTTLLPQHQEECQQQLEATLYEPRTRPQKPDRDPRGEDFYANVGYAIRTLRDELPTLFQEDLTYDIYRDDIAFKDPRNCIEGKKNYKTIFWSLRFHGALFFTRLHVDVQRIWQPEEALIRARWTVRGEPRVPWRAQGSFDGISEFKLDSNGKIYQHKVDNTILNDPPYLKLPIFGLNLLGRPIPQTPPALPGGFFRDAPQQLLQNNRTSEGRSSNNERHSGPSSPAPV